MIPSIGNVLQLLRSLALKASLWRDAQLDTLRFGSVVIAARVTEMVSRLELSEPSSCPQEQSLARFVIRALAIAVPRRASCP
jgi:hypothetical protein